MTEVEQTQTAIEQTEGVEKAETSTKYSGRKSFAFSDKEMYDSVEALLGQKPEGLTNAEFLHQALKQYVESEEINQSLNHLPMQAVDLFKGDLEKLNIAFEMIRETFKTQMLASTQLIQQREEKLTRQWEKERGNFEQLMEGFKIEVQTLTAQKYEQEKLMEQANEWKEELLQLRPTVTTLQQALEASQKQVQQLQSVCDSHSTDEVNHWKEAYTAVKENIATTTLRLQHAQEQEAQAKEQIQALQNELERANQSIKQHQDELKEVREELATSHRTIQELYQKLLKA